MNHTLLFTFENCADTGIIERFLQRCMSAAPTLETRLVRRQTQTLLFARGTAEALGQFGEVLALEIPTSLFLSEANVTIATEWPAENEQWNLPNIPLNIPPCAHCVANVNDPHSHAYTNPFHFCPCCGYTKSLAPQPRTLEWHEPSGVGTVAHASEEFPLLFQQCVETLRQGESVAVRTFSGWQEVAMIDAQSARNRRGATLIFADLSGITRWTHATPEEEKLCATIEKPALFVPVREALRQRAHSDWGGIWCALPDDLMLFLIAQPLADAESLPLVTWPCDDPENASYRLSFSGELFQPEQRPRIACTDSTPRIRDGQRSLDLHALPHNEVAGTIVCHAPLGSEALALYQIGHDGQQTAVPCAIDQTQTVTELVQSITTLDEGAARLLETFRATYPEIWQHLSHDHTPLHLGSVWHVWGVASRILGQGNAENTLDDDAAELESIALQQPFAKGPRLQYGAPQGTSFEALFDPRWLLRSVISYRMAGASPAAIAFGCIESFADFTAHAVASQLADASQTLTPVLTGGIWTNRILAMQVGRIGFWK